MIAVLFYLASVVAANLAVTYLPPLQFGGLQAPAGVLFVGLTLVLRDFVHRQYGVRGSVAVIAVAAAISSLFASPELLLASVVAFAVAELLDLAVFVPTSRRRGFVTAVILSGIVGSIVDSYLFLQLAGFPLGQFFWGQLVGKLTMTFLAAGTIYAVQRRRSIA